MKRMLSFALVAACGLLAGCVVTSVYPFFTDKDLVFEPALVGDWVDAGNTNKPSEYVRIEPVGGKGYLATLFDTKETNSVEVHLFRLNRQLFLDTCSTNRSLDFVPIHQVSKVTQLGPVLETANLNYDWLSKLLEKNPRAVRHMVLRENPGDEHGRIVLTAETWELQRFILEYLDHTNAWREPSRFKHRD
jgi:hypothetical protein